MQLSVVVCVRVKHIVPGAVKSIESILCNFTPNKAANKPEQEKQSEYCQSYVLQ